MVEQNDFKLRCELIGHQEDVRAVTTCELGVLTSSRDTTVKLWVEDGPTAYMLLQTLTGHAKYVGALAYAPPGCLAVAPSGAVVAGGFDGRVLMWDAASGEQLLAMDAHAYQVTGLAVLPDGMLASASVDKSIKLWRGSEAAGELTGHEGPVLCLTATPDGQLISGSGDGTLRRWQGNRCMHVYRGHQDSVRGVALLPGLGGFVSGSHDCSLRVWTLQGDCLAEMHGHSAIIYAVAATATGLIASGSEDNTVKLWRPDGSCLQTLPHPGCVWGVAFTPGGDVVSACSDAVARVWSAEADRQAPAEAAAAYEARLAERAAAAAAAARDSEAGAGAGAGASIPGLPPGVSVADAAELAAPGSRDGETKLVREADGGVNVYSWAAARSTWELLGAVVEPPSAPGSLSAGRRQHAGRSWDYVFDVELDGGVSLKLACDDAENPYDVAERFLAEHDLPGEFKEQIVRFVLDNTGAGRGRGPRTDAGAPITGGFCDPFTGGSSEQPTAPPHQRPTMVAPTPGDVTGGGVDPFTGAAATAAAVAAAAAAPTQGGAPAAAYLLFDVPPPSEPLRRKLLELSGGGEVPESLRITAAELAPGGPLDQLLSAVEAATAGGSGAPPSAAALGLARRLLGWPGAALFPCLDVARCLVLQPEAAAALAEHAGSLEGSNGGSGLGAALAAAAAVGAPPGLQTGLRSAANCFRAPPLRVWLLSQLGPLLDAYTGMAASPGGTKAVRLAMATLLLNGAIAGGGADGDVRLQLLSAVVTLLDATPEGEADAAARTAAALSTLLGVPDGGELAAVARDLGAGAALQRLRGALAPGSAAASALDAASAALK